MYLRVYEWSPSNNTNLWADSVNIRTTRSSGNSIGFFGTTPAGQYGPIGPPTGGSTVDTEGRTAIQEILDLLEQYGLSE